MKPRRILFEPAFPGELHLHCLNRVKLNHAVSNYDYLLLKRPCAHFGVGGQITAKSHITLFVKSYSTISPKSKVKLNVSLFYTEIFKPHGLHQGFSRVQKTNYKLIVSFSNQ